MMLVRVTIHAGLMPIIDTCTQAESTAEALADVISRPSVAEHLQDLKTKSLKVEAQFIERMEGKA